MTHPTQLYQFLFDPANWTRSPTDSRFDDPQVEPGELEAMRAEMTDLLDELEHLRAENAHLRNIVGSRDALAESEQSKRVAELEAMTTELRDLVEKAHPIIMTTCYMHENIAGTREWISAYEDAAATDAALSKEPRT